MYVCVSLSLKLQPCKQPSPVTQIRVDVSQTLIVRTLAGRGAGKRIVRHTDAHTHTHTHTRSPGTLHLLTCLALLQSMVTAPAVPVPVAVPMAVPVSVPMAVSVSVAVPVSVIVSVTSSTVAAAATVTNRSLLLLHRRNRGPVLRPAPRPHCGARRTSVIRPWLDVWARHSGKRLKGLGIPG